MNEDLSENIERAAREIERLRRRVIREQAAIFADHPEERPSIREMEQAVWVNSHQPIAWPEWPPGVTAKVKAAGQKIVRRLLQWYIDPIVQQQNRFNQATLAAVRSLAQEVAQLQAQQSPSQKEG